ncbi:hypothetical protein [Arthrobacter sp. N1]|uniref:hypothetical protein n=1 Tax=Arthrobacter sp. N1 TaxID=619291 RepID=UPI003BB14546
MTLPSPARLLCAALLSFGLLGSAVPAMANDAVPAAPPSTAPAPPSTAPTSPATVAPRQALESATLPATAPEAPVPAETVPATEKRAAAAEPSTVKPSEAAAGASPPAASPAPNEVTSFVPDLNWNPLNDPGSNARYGEHFAQPVTPLKTASPLGLDDAGGSAAIAPRSGTFNVTLVTVQLSGKTVADTDAINMTAARNSITGANAYWNSASAGRLSITKVNELRHKSAAKITDSYGTIMATVTKELNWQYRSYESLVIFVPHADLNYNGSWGILGGGFTDSATSGRVIMPYPSALTNNVVTHEFGHVLGLHHANSLACSNGRVDAERTGSSWGNSGCWSSEYSDMSDLMGYAQVSSPMINAFLWEYGGFGSGDEIRNIGTPSNKQQYTLRPWGGTDRQRALKFTDPVSKEVYYLELRAPVGFDRTAAVGGNQGVKITKQDILGWSGNASVVLTPNSSLSGYSNRALTWKAGQSFVTHSGTRVEITSTTFPTNQADAASAVVTITPPTMTPAAAMSAISSVVAGSPQLGGAKSEVQCGLVGGGCYQNFVNGAVIWSSASGAAVSLNGQIRSAWLASGAQNGALGYPKAAQVCGIRDNGCYQSFQNGEVFWSTASGAAISKAGVIRTAYRGAGAENGALGFPIGPETCGLKADGCFQAFQQGEIIWSSTSGARISKAGPIRTAYRASGAENGALGYPTSSEICGLRLSGCYQAFQRGEILYTTNTGAQISRAGLIRTAYRASGAENGVLGYPTGKETCGLKDGGCYQSFQKGEMAWSPATGAQIIYTSPIRTAYRAANAENGRLGYPLTSQACGLRDSGCTQTFQGGEIYWSSATGAIISRKGRIRDLYLSSGAQDGRLSYPITAEICGLRDGGCYQGFQRGEIYWSPTTGARTSTTGSIRTAYRNAKSENGILGYPLTHEICGLRDAGCYQSYQNGEIMWSPKTGAKITATGPIRTAYRKAGAENGTLGYPTTNQTCPTTTRRTQTFQRGTLTWTSTTGVKRT